MKNQEIGEKMATNVNPEELNYDHYATAKYDDDIVRSIPGHVELHQHIDQLVESLPEQPKILELGIGTGLTAERILRRFPRARYSANDFSKTMLDGARDRLQNYDVQYLEGDYSLIDLPTDNDAIISVIGIHHQETNEDKRNLFQRIYNSLNERGVFIFGDLVTYRTPTEAALNETKHFEYLRDNAQDEESFQEWKDHHERLNKLAHLEDQVEWLREVGFREVEVLFQKYNTVLVYAKK
jgi:tRNA (cmo5U34)-methyltransferase